MIAALGAYILSLAGAAACVGAFVRQVFGHYGYVQGFEMELLAAFGAALAYVCVETAYVGAVKILAPTRSPGPLIAESLSNAAALLLTPYLLGIDVPWPHPMLKTLEPALFLGAFGAVHGFVKLVSFFSALWGAPGSRLEGIVWFAVSGFFGAVAAGLGQQWRADFDKSRTFASETVEYRRCGETYAEAREMPEGAQMSYAIEPSPGMTLEMRWAEPPAEDGTLEPLGSAYVTVRLEGAETVERSFRIELEADAWSELEVPADAIPRNTRLCHVAWTSGQGPEWERLTGIRPIVTSGRRLWLSGPYAHEMRGDKTPANVVVLLADGIAARHVSGLGYKRSTTPTLDRLAKEALALRFAYTPAPETAAAAMTLLTGASPLRHGYLGARRGPLPPTCRMLQEILAERHYATAAFTEGEGPDNGDLVFGTDFKLGFETFDASYRATPRAEVAEDGTRRVAAASGSQATFDKAKAWIDAHADTSFMVFVRLSELQELRWRDRYAPGFVNDAANASGRDVYDSGLTWLDRTAGEFVRNLRANAATKDTCIVLTSPYGFDFTNAEEVLPSVALTENCLRVPLYLWAPFEENSAAVPEMAGLEDVMPTLLALTRAAPRTLDGNSLLSNVGERYPVSMRGDPLVMSMRKGPWRFSWQSGLSPFTYAANGEDLVVGLYSLERADAQGASENRMGQNQELVSKYRLMLRTYLNAFKAVRP